MTDRSTLCFVQLPIPPLAPFLPSGNVSLAAGCLAVAVRSSALAQRLRVEILPAAKADLLGDTLLADAVANGAPEFVGLSLYLWNVERSLYLATEIKRRSPKTCILIGGPEVNSDNTFVLNAPGWDVALVGEAEESITELLTALLDGATGEGVPGAVVRNARGELLFTPPRSPTFALTRFPSPYLEGILPVERDHSTYVESVRGCKSHCTFCFYPRSSAALRVLDVPQSRDLLARLRDLGAGEIVFLDPTFNHRPQFEELLLAIADLNPDRRLSFFAEVRAEGLTERHADQLAAANFTKLEIGLQSINPKTLARTKRGGKPDQVVRAARLLKERKIELLVDLIVGLPGDTREDVLAGARFLAEHELGEYAQVFPLSVLAGTEMRSHAAVDGLKYDPQPPYRVQRTPAMDEAELRATFLEAEQILERRLDEEPRPLLVDASTLLSASAPAVFTFDVERASDAEFRAATQPGAVHAALWITGGDLWARSDRIAQVLHARMAVDPYSVLDVVLAPQLPFPVNLLEFVRRCFASGPPSYLSRVLEHRGEDAGRRIWAVIARGLRWPADYVRHLSELVPVYQEQTLQEAIDRAEDLGDLLPRARVIDAPSADADRALTTLVERADLSSVSFAHAALEQRFIRRVLQVTA